MIAVSQIAVALKKELGSYFSTEAHRDNDILRYINSAVRAIVIARNFTFNQYIYNITATELITTYNIPYQVETFFVKKDGEIIDFLNFKEFNFKSDKKDCIGIWDNTLQTFIPGEYEIFYRGIPKQIINLNDSLEIPEHFYDLVLLKATYFGFMDVRAYDKANNKEAIFIGMIKDMATRNSNPQPMKIKRLNKSKHKVW